MKRLLILGNGYHIGNKYKTSYKDFKKYIEIFECCKKEFENKNRIKNDLREYWFPATSEMFITNDILEYIKETISSSQINYEDIEFADSFKKTSLYYLLNNPENSMDLWSDVEEGIKVILTKIYSYYHEDYSDDDAIKQFCQSKLGEKQALDELYNDVEIFEKAFASYLLIFNVSYDCGSYNKINNEYININTNDTLKEFLNKDTSIISFNYFKCTGDADMLIRKNDNNGKEYINIHNTVDGNRGFDKSIIIGIQDGCFNNPLYKRFEKKQRLYSQDISYIDEILDSLNIYDEFIVYGHSLGKSDYYFFSKIIDFVIRYDKRLIIYYYTKEGKKRIQDNIKYYIHDNLQYESIKNKKLNIDYREILVHHNKP